MSQLYRIAENPSTIVQNPSGIYQKLYQNQWKCVLGPFSAPNRAQVGSRTLDLNWGTAPFGTFWPKMALEGAMLGPSGIPKSVKNRTFGPRSAQGPSKNGLRKGVWKKHEKLMKKRCRNGWFLMARNHVWRYTLRLFHTFAIFEKSRKIDATTEAESHTFW